MVNKISRLRVGTTAQAVLIYAACLVWPQLAQSQAVQIIKPPKTQLWMNVSSGSTSELGLTLWNSTRPGVPVTMEIPPGMLMGERLTLLPPQSNVMSALVQQHKPSAGDYGVPKGRLLMYWGCGTKVQRSQPRIVDFSMPDSSSVAAFAAALEGAHVPESDISIKPDLVVYPTELGSNNFPKGASLVGEHRLKGEAIAPSFAFKVAGEIDAMPAIDLRTIGSLQDRMTLRWSNITGARAYFLHAMVKQGDDIILWSSSALPDAGTAIFNYLPNATLERWVKDRVLLGANAKRCTIPKGILAGQGGVLRMMAFGAEHNLVHPERPANPNVAWEPEWAVHLRRQSHIITVLDASDPAAGSTKGRDILPPAPAIILRDPSNFLRGILGG